MKILPRLKHYTKKDGKFVFPKEPGTKIVFDNRIAAVFVESFVKVFHDYFFQMTRADLSLRKGEERIFFHHIQNADEYYEIDIQSDRIDVRYTDTLSVRNAMATLISLTIQDKGAVYIPCASIQDHPNYHHRGMLIDVARRFIPLEELKMHIRTLGLCKYNYLHWHLSDTTGFAFEVKSLPKLSEMAQRRVYTQEELRELVAYAKGFGIESIPEIDIPAHCEYFTSVYPELLCDVVEPRDTDRPISKYTLCLSNPKTYEMATELIRELCDIFDGEYFHLGGDELYFYDLDSENLWPEWQYCSHCKELAKKEHIESDLDFYIYFANKMHKVVTSFGKKMIVYNDAIDISKPTKLDKDIIIQFWRVAMPQRGPIEGCSMQGFIDQGFQVINSYFPETYMCDFIKEDALRNWHPTANPVVEKGTERSVIGSEVCAWGVHNHFDYSTLAILCYFSDRVWNDEPMEESEEIDAAFVRQTVSHDLSTPHIFSILGRRIPPLNDYDKYYDDKIDRDLEKVENAVAELTKLYHRGVGEIRAIRGYLYVLQEIRNMLRKEQNLPMVDTTLWGFIPENILRKEGKMR